MDDNKEYVPDYDGVVPDYDGVVPDYDDDVPEYDYKSDLLTDGSQLLSAFSSRESSSNNLNLTAVPKVVPVENVPEDHNDSTSVECTAQKENEANNINLSKKTVEVCNKKKETGTNKDYPEPLQRVRLEDHKNIRVRNYDKSTNNNKSGLNEDSSVELNKPLLVGNIQIQPPHPGIEFNSLADVNEFSLGLTNQKPFKVPTCPPPSRKSTTPKGSNSLQAASLPSSTAASSRSAISAQTSLSIASTGIPYKNELKRVTSNGRESTTYKGSTSLLTTSRPTSTAACSKSGNSASTSHSTFGTGSPSLQKVSRPSFTSASSRSANSATQPYWNELKLRPSSKGSTCLLTASQHSCTVTSSGYDNSASTTNSKFGAGNQSPPPSSKLTSAKGSTYVQTVRLPSCTVTSSGSDNSASTPHSTFGAGNQPALPTSSKSTSSEGSTSVQAVSGPSSMATSSRSNNSAWNFLSTYPDRDPYLNEVDLGTSNGGNQRSTNNNRSVSRDLYLSSELNTDQLAEQYIEEGSYFDFGLNEDPLLDSE